MDLEKLRAFKVGAASRLLAMKHSPHASTRSSVEAAVTGFRRERGGGGTKLSVPLGNAERNTEHTGV